MNKRKTILHVMGMPSSKYGGIEHYCVELASQLSVMGYHNMFIFESVPASREFIDDMQATGSELLTIPSRGHALRFSVAFVRLLLNYNVCLVHAHFTKARFYAVPFAHLLGVKRIFYTLHSDIEPLAHIKPLTRLWYHWTNRYSKIITVSNQIKATASSNWPSVDIQRIYLGIEPICGDRVAARKALGIAEDKIIVLTIANFNHIKGLDVAVEALALIKKSDLIESVELWIVGQSDNEIEKLRKYAAQKEVLDKVRMFGIKNDVALYISAADIYIQPSRSEGLPISIMEAMSYGLPIVASNVGGIPEAIEDGVGGILVHAEEPSKLADATIDLIGNKQKRVAFGYTAKIKQQAMFSRKKNVRKLINAYRIE